jgi:hypothetical protein
MSPTELKMQPTIHLERKAGYRRGKYPALPSKCIVGCIFNSVGVTITHLHFVYHIYLLQYIVYLYYLND